MVGIDTTGAAKSVTGKLRQKLIGLADDLLVSLGCQRRVDQSTVLHPDAPHHFGAAALVRLAIGGEVAVYRCCNLIHFMLLGIGDSAIVGLGSARTPLPGR